MIYKPFDEHEPRCAAKLTTENDIASAKNHLLRRGKTFYNADKRKCLGCDEISYLKVAAQLLPEEPFDISTWDKWTSEIKVKTGKTGKELYMPLRLALTGQEKGPELKYLLPLLKREHILMKLES